MWKLRLKKNKPCRIPCFLSDVSELRVNITWNDHPSKVVCKVHEDTPVDFLFNYLPTTLAIGIVAHAENYGEKTGQKERCEGNSLITMN